MKARLQFGKKPAEPANRKEMLWVALLALLAGLIAKMPYFIGIEDDVYFQRNLGFILFPSLIFFFAWKTKLAQKYLLACCALLAATAVFINLLPHSNSDTLILACMHLPLLLWTVTGFSYTGGDIKNTEMKIGFLRYNGDLLVMSAVMMIAGAILTGISIGLFELIDLNIAEWYMKNIAIWGAAAVPVLATYMVQRNPQLVQQVSPIIARIFTPLVLVLLLAYLGAMVFTGKDPYNDREFLFIFNLLLIGVMAIILFSVAERGKQNPRSVESILLLALAIATLFVNGIALSAIIFRISSWGITPNRMAVLGSNLLMLIHLLIVSHRLFIGLRNKNNAQNIEAGIASFLPVYSIWTAIVVFLFPLLFGFK
ncbi:MAG: hypothetical protein FJX94_01740 [Bacteroidetes bacterium]|nr:hypothetical protein [Bacteroidota bacterium]